ncbi:MAG: NADH-quinone oxidoreductase subunit J [Anaerolineae bacterium]|nr:NADH-quinone oxidoreductase subunit J [Anaerolineae bacterium]
MTTDLVLFIVVAGVAILSAALMLVSRNAVHSALFLIVNLLCVAFFYLMLNAPFLAMVQITVYAGAIMVLFMFVIMLLGADRVGGAAAKYPWIAPAAAALASLFLIVAVIVVVQANTGALQPIPRAPEVRFSHVNPDAPALDLYLNAERVAADLSYGETSEFTQAAAGDYNLLAFPACTEADPAQCPDPLATGATPLIALPVSLQAETDTSYVVAETADGAPQLVTVPTDLTPLTDENTWRLTVVNALPGETPVSLVQLDPNNPTTPRVLVPELPFGAASETLTLPRGTVELAWRQGDAVVGSARGLTPRNKTHELIILAQERVPTAEGGTTTRPRAIRVEPTPNTRETFGSPQHIGHELLTTYLLPFEIVAILLLGTMVGAILLTREDVKRRAERRKVVSPVARRINKAAEAAQNAQAAASESNPAAETVSAD